MNTDRLLLVLFFSFVTGMLLAQPSNDDCSNPVFLTDVTDFCSAQGAYTTEGATASSQGTPTCVPSAEHDVWFAFTAEATDLLIQITGSTSTSPGGTLPNPEVVLYEFDCNNLTDIACISDAFDNNQVETYASGLNPGNMYLLRVDDRNGAEGTFQICLNNFNKVPDPNSDCNTGVLLCDKSSFTVPSVLGEGSVLNEIPPNTCPSEDSDNELEENSSVWYKWTCDESGSLTFTLNPNDPNDDLDFVVFSLPNGIDDCADKEVLRCMASGENVNQPFETWEPCTGATGLSLSDDDFGEMPGCQAGDNNFASSIDMVEGESYALVVNNFTNSGNGFTIDWGGTGTFLGPEPGIDIRQPVDTPYCLLDSIQFVDSSITPTSEIVNWDWTFGSNAEPQTATGPGPHWVNYGTAGAKTITLTIETEAGCITTTTENSFFLQCCFASVDVDAGEDKTVQLGFSTPLNTSVQLPGEEVTLFWEPDSTLSCSNCPFPTATPGRETTYTLTAVDEFGCRDVDSVNVRVEIIRPLYIPNVFSPNNDGINDHFTIYSGPAATEIEYLRIYNRWGSLVFEGRDFPTNENDLGWDGTFNGEKVNPGVFVYQAVVNFLDDTQKNVSGDVTVVR